MISDLVNGFSFRILGPDAPMASDRRWRLRRPDGSVAILLELPNARLETLVIDFGDQDEELKTLLSPLLEVRKMSRLPIAATLQRAVKQMSSEHAFINVGVWNGFTMLSAMAGNEDKTCIGVDNFSEFGGPKEDFLTQFLTRRSRCHRFYDLDYRDFFAEGIDQPLGAYLYDGEHSYANQYNGLMAADPFFVEGSVVVVDDTNLARARDATLQFVEDSWLDWKVLLDMRTSGNQHITLWDGLMLLEATRSPREQITWPVSTSLASVPVAEGSPSSLGLSVINLSNRPLEPRYGVGSVEVIDADTNETLSAAVDATTGGYILFVQSETAIPWDIVERSAASTHLSLGASAAASA
jgi:hypothetical protein